MRLVPSFDNRGGMTPPTDGLAESIKFPGKGHPEVVTLYDWRLPDGQPGDIITKGQLGMQVVRHVLNRYIRATAETVKRGIPENYTGVICIDEESHDVFYDAGSLTENQNNLALFPTHTRYELKRMFMEETVSICRQWSPNAEIHWWQLGMSHHQWLVTQPGFYEDRLRQARNTGFVNNGDMYLDHPYYFPVHLNNMVDRASSLRRQYYIYRQFHFSRGWAYINCRHDYNAPAGKAMQWLTKEELSELLGVVKDFRYPVCALWEAIESVEIRNQLQKWIDETLVPVAKSLGVM